MVNYVLSIYFWARPLFNMLDIFFLHKNICYKLADTQELIYEFLYQTRSSVT
jgi:hypothetical protein